MFPELATGVRWYTERCVVGNTLSAWRTGYQRPRWTCTPTVAATWRRHTLRTMTTNRHHAGRECLWATGFLLKDWFTYMYFYIYIYILACTSKELTILCVLCAVRTVLTATTIITSPGRYCSTRCGRRNMFVVVGGRSFVSNTTTTAGEKRIACLLSRSRRHDVVCVRSFGVAACDKMVADIRRAISRNWRVRAVDVPPAMQCHFGGVGSMGDNKKKATTSDTLPKPGKVNSGKYYTLLFVFITFGVW